MSEFPCRLTWRKPDWETRAMARLDEIIRYPSFHDPEAVELAVFARDLMIEKMAIEANYRSVMNMEIERRRNEPATIVVKVGHEY